MSAVGFSLIADSFNPRPGETEEAVLLVLTFSLGGLSLAGPPLLLWRRYRSGWKRMRLGELFWFCQGTASWLLWPPAIYVRVQGKKAMGDGMSEICYFYGTPLMHALYRADSSWPAARWPPGTVGCGCRSWTEAF